MRNSMRALIPWYVMASMVIVRLVSHLHHLNETVHLNMV